MNFSRKKSHFAEIALLVALTIAAVGLFSDRAVFADEHIFLRLAESALSNPLYPADTPAIFFGIRLPNYIGHTHPPATEYYLAMLYKLIGGFDEVPFRLLFALFPILAVLSFYALARRFTAEPFFVAALFLVSPAFFVVAPTFMMDIPIIAFLLAGLALYFHGRLLPAAICFTLAVGSGYTALVPLGCLGLVMLLSRRPWKELASVLTAPAVLMVWLLVMTAHFGEFPLAQTFRYLTFQNFSAPPFSGLVKLRLFSIGVNTLATLSFLGGVLVFPGTIRLKSRKAWLWATVLALILSILAPSSLAPGVLYRAWFGLLALFGIMVLAACVGAAAQIMRSKTKNGGEPLLILWVPSVLIFFVAVGEMIAARYLLLVLPAIFLMIFRESSRSDLVATIIPTVLLSTTLAHADRQFVNSYRDWVDANVTTLQRQGFRVYGGAESGLRFELERAGAETLLAGDRRPRGTDLIVRQEMFTPSLGEDLEVTLTEVKAFPLESAFPLRTFSRTSHAGFWGSTFGLAPYVWSSAPFDVIHVLEVNPLVSELPQGSTDPERAVVYSTEGPLFRQSRPELFFRMQVPTQTTVEYDLAGGTGRVEQTPDGIRLINEGTTPLDWRRLRFTPSEWVSR